jgi:hypothetical protein
VNQTLALIVGASVLMMTALSVMFLSNNALSDLGKSTEEQKISSVCEFQVKQYRRGSVTIDEVDQRCLKYIDDQSAQNTYLSQDTDVQNCLTEGNC